MYVVKQRYDQCFKKNKFAGTTKINIIAVVCDTFFILLHNHEFSITLETHISVIQRKYMVYYTV